MTPTSDLLAAFASAFDQTHRLITLDIGSNRQWDGRLLPQRVECLSPEAGLALRQLIGQPAWLVIRDQDGQEVRRIGIISTAQAPDSAAGSGVL